MRVDCHNVAGSIPVNRDRAERCLPKTTPSPRGRTHPAVEVGCSFISIITVKILNTKTYMNKFNLPIGSIIDFWISCPVHEPPKALEISQENKAHLKLNHIGDDKTTNLDNKMISSHYCQCLNSLGLSPFQEQGHLGRNLGFQLLYLLEKLDQREF